jgi:hypothetical protein
MSSETILIIALVVQGLAIVAGFLLCLWLFFLALPGFLWGPPFVGSRPEWAEEIVALAKPQPGQLALDLGSGDGRLLLAMAERGCRGVGYEVNLFLVWLSRWRAWRQGASVTVHWRDFSQADVREADLVMLYGVDRSLARLARKLKREMKPGALIVSLRYPIPDWPTDERRDAAFLYRISPS